MNKLQLVLLEFYYNVVHDALLPESSAWLVLNKTDIFA